MRRNVNTEQMNDQITHPQHYAACAPSWEPIDIIERYRMNFHVGNALKYIVRCERSGKRDSDVMKALYYLTRNKAMKVFDLPQAIKVEGDEYTQLERRIMDDNVFNLESPYLRSAALLCIVDPDSALHLFGDPAVHQKQSNG